MTKELLLKRLEELKAGRKQAEANLHATEGAIQEVEYWLKELEKNA